MRSFFRLQGPRQAAGGRLLQLPVEKIAPSPWQARRQFDAAQLQALAESIRQNGMLQPVTVRRTGPDSYQLIAGERRLRAARLLGLSQLPAILVEYEEIRAQVLSLEENLQRQQLGPLEEAEAMRQLLALWDCSQAQGAARLGLSQSALANKLRLLSLPGPVQALAQQAPALTERHLRALLRLPDAALQLRAAQEILRGQMTVAAAERLVERMLRGPQKPPPPQKRGMVRDVRIFVNTVNRAVELMKNAGIPAQMECSQEADCLRYYVTIPLSAPPAQEKAPFAAAECPASAQGSAADAGPAGAGLPETSPAAEPCAPSPGRERMPAMAGGQNGF